MVTVPMSPYSDWVTIITRDGELGLDSAVLASRNVATGLRIDGMRNDLLDSRGQYQSFLGCSYCGKYLTGMEVMSRHSGPILGLVYYRFDCCERCGWWKIGKEFKEDSGTTESTVYEGILKRFDPSAIDASISEVRRRLQMATDIAYALRPTVFEKLVQAVYQDYYGKAEVRHVGGPGDNGVDLYAIIDDEPCVVQVKRRQASQYHEGPQVVRELAGTILMHGVSYGHLVTTAGGFTPAAYATRHTLAKARTPIRIELKSLDDLLRMLGVANKNLHPTWETLLVPLRDAMRGA